ncbi:hypothetical protein [Komagataeibacter xylinus]|uniref:hypothetical protein n=1 Tax=Komagataeibacter xylinus TaxID=28448 RepID=UPI0013EE97F3|nr:hypothetical protein [Komagataeibacter xylinus]
MHRGGKRENPSGDSPAHSGNFPSPEDNALLVKGLFKNNSLMKNDRSFWALPFFQKAAFFKAF